MVDKHIHFKGATSYMMWLEAQRAINGPMPTYGGDIGQDNPKVQDGITAMFNGDERHVEKANAMVDQIMEVAIETPKKTKRRAQAGYRPDIPSYILGRPRDMWSMKKIPQDRTPLRVYVGLTSSASIDEDDLVTRGCALAAFIIAMSNVRPIVLVPFVTLGSSEQEDRPRYGRSRSRRRSYFSEDPPGVRNMLISWEISTQPLLMSEIMSLSLPEVTRFVGIEACRHLFGQDARYDPSFHRDSFEEDKMRAHLGCEPEDLYLPCIHREDPIFSDPIKWVNTMIAAYTSGDSTDRDFTPSEY